MKQMRGIDATNRLALAIAAVILVAACGTSVQSADGTAPVTVTTAGPEAKACAGGADTFPPGDPCADDDRDDVRNQYDPCPNQPEEGNTETAGCPGQPDTPDAPKYLPSPFEVCQVSSSGHWAVLPLSAEALNEINTEPGLRQRLENASVDLAELQASASLIVPRDDSAASTDCGIPDSVGGGTDPLLQVDEVAVTTLDSDAEFDLISEFIEKNPVEATKEAATSEAISDDEAETILGQIPPAVLTEVEQSKEVAIIPARLDVIDEVIEGG